jgi:hypothetical protein
MTADLNSLVRESGGLNGAPLRGQRAPGALVIPREGIVRPAEGLPSVFTTLEHHNGYATMRLMRGNSREHKVEQSIKLGPNSVHAFITHPDGTYTNLGESHNLLTNLGRDWWADGLGFKAPLGGQGSPLTATTATSATCTATPWTASNFGTPQPGLSGMAIVVPITSLTTTPVMGLIGSNTNAVATIDKWWTPDLAGTGTNPANTSAFYITPGRAAGALFMALTTNTAAANATTTSLTSEATTAGATRAKGTYAHTYGAATLTITNAFSITGPLTALHRMALFTCSTLAATGIPVFEAVLSLDATVDNLDTLTVTDTITLSG